MNWISVYWLVKIIEDLDPDNFTKREFVEEFGDLNRSPEQSLGRQLKILERDGYVERQSRRRYYQVTPLGYVLYERT